MKNKITAFFMSLILLITTMPSGTMVSAAADNSSESVKLSGIKVIGYSGYTNEDERPEFAFDSDTETKWCDNSNGDVGWIAFSLPEVKILTNITVTHAEGHGVDHKENNTIEFSVQRLKDGITMPQNPENAFLNDNNNWVDIIKVNNSTQESITTNEIVSADKNKYYRFYVSDGDAAYEWNAVRIYEIELFGKTDYVNPVKVTYEANDGTGKTEVVTKEKGNNIVLPVCMFTAPLDKEFEAWEVNGTEYQPGATITVENDINVKAIWKTVDNVTVSFDSNGGTGTINSERIRRGSTYTLPECTFTAPLDKEFKAWEVNGTEYQPNDTITVNDDTVVKAVWMQIFYANITFDANGATGEMPAVKWNKRLSYTLPECGFTHNSGEFLNWIVNGEEKDPGSSIVLTNDTIIKANWKIIKYIDIIFDANGAQGKMDKVRWKTEDKYTLPECAFTYENKSFVAWEVNGDYIEEFDSVWLEDSVTLKAIWNDIVNCTVTFDANGGAGEMAPVTADKNRKYYTPLCAFTAPAGKVFAGWQVGNSKDPEPERKPVWLKGNTTIKPVWKTYAELGLKEPVTTPFDFMKMESVNNLETKGYKWDKESHTLTINGLNMLCDTESAWKNDNEYCDITIIVEGNNVIRNTSTTTEGYGISGYSKMIFKSENNGKLSISAKQPTCVKAVETYSDNGSLNMIFSGLDNALNAGSYVDISGGTVEAYGRLAVNYGFYGFTLRGNTVLKAFGENNGIAASIFTDRNNAANNITIYTNRLLHADMYISDRITNQMTIFQEDNAGIKKSYISGDETFENYIISDHELMYIKPTGTVTFKGKTKNFGTLINKGLLNNAGTFVNVGKLENNGTLQGNKIDGNDPTENEQVDVTYIGKDGKEVTEKAYLMKDMNSSGEPVRHVMEATTYVVRGHVSSNYLLSVSDSKIPCKIIVEDGAHLKLSHLHQRNGTVEIYSGKLGTGEVVIDQLGSKFDNLSVYGGNVRLENDNGLIKVKIDGKATFNRGNIKGSFLAKQIEVNGATVNAGKSTVADFVVNSGIVNLDGNCEINSTNFAGSVIQFKNVNGTINNNATIEMEYSDYKNAGNYIKSLKLSGTNGRVKLLHDLCSPTNYILYDNNGNYVIDEHLFPDTAFRTYVETNFDKNNNKILETDEIEGATRIDVSELNGLNDITGYEVFTNLKYLNINNRTSLEKFTVSENLEELHTRNTVIKKYDMTNAKNLKVLDCAHTPVNKIDFSHSPNLKFLDVYYTIVNVVDIRNINLDTLFISANTKTVVINDNQKLFNKETNVQKLKVTDGNATYSNNAVKFKNNRVKEAKCEYNLNNLSDKFRITIINGDYLAYAPENVKTTNCIGDTKGKISGVDDKMEYQKKGDSTWIAVTGNEITNLDSGTYYVRLKADEFYQPGESTEVTIFKQKAELQELNGNYVLGTKKDTLKIELTKTPGAQYSKDGTLWQDSNVFDNLEPKTYTFYARIKAEGDVLESNSISREIVFEKFENKVNSVSIKSWSYNDKPDKPSATSEHSDNVIFTYAKKGTDKFTTTVPHAAGEYTLKAEFPESKIYKSAFATKDFAISKVTYNLYVGTQKADKNGEATIPVIIRNNKGIVDFDFKIDSDPDIVDILFVTSDMTRGSLAFDNWENRVSYKGRNIRSDGTLLNIRVKFRKGMRQDTKITILPEKNNINKNDDDSIILNVESGCLTTGDGMIFDDNVTDNTYHATVALGDNFRNDSVCAILAFYKGNKLVETKLNNVNVVNNKAEISIPMSTKDYDSYKFMVWESMGTMKPVITISEDDILVVVKNEEITDTTYSAQLSFSDKYDKQTAEAILCFYKDGKLVEMKQQTVNKGKDVDVSFALSTEPYDSCKLMVWESIASQKPLN